MAARKKDETEAPVAPPEAGPATDEQAAALASEPSATQGTDAPDPRVREANGVEALHAEAIERRNRRQRIDPSTIAGGLPESEAHVHDFDRSVGTTERPRFATVAEAEEAGPVERLGSDVFPVLVCACGARVLGPRVGG